MNYEKAYKEALEKARTIHNEHHAQCHDVMTKVFPELRESDDEKLSKKLHECVCRAINNDKLPYEERKYISEKVIPYLENLEKQNEQKITNSKEDIDFTIYYPLKNGNGKYECIPYSFYGSLTSFSDNEDLIDFLRNCFYTKQKCEDWIKKQDEQKPAWSEEDEKNLNTIINVIHGGTHLAYENEIDWLKSLKYRNKRKVIMNNEQINCIESLVKEALMQRIIRESGDIFGQKFDNGNLLEGIKRNLSSNGIELEDDEIVKYMEKAALPILMEVYFKECFYMCGYGKDEKVGIYAEKAKKWINRFSNDISELYKREYEA